MMPDDACPEQPGGPAATAADERWLRLAVELSHACPPSATAFSVGAVLVDDEEREVARGHSRELGPHHHAEESAVEKALSAGRTVAGTTLYSSLEPCGERKSRPVCCSRLVVDAGIRRVVMAWREPATFVADCKGLRLLREAEVEVVEIPQLADAAMVANRHLLPSPGPGA